MRNKITSVLSVLLTILMVASISSQMAFAATPSSCEIKSYVSTPSNSTLSDSTKVAKDGTVYLDIYLNNTTTTGDMSGINNATIKLQYDSDNFSIGTAQGTDYILGNNVPAEWGIIQFTKTGSGNASYLNITVGDPNYNDVVLKTSTEAHVLRLVFTANGTASINKHDFTYVTSEGGILKTYLGSYDGHIFAMDTSINATTYSMAATNAQVEISTLYTISFNAESGSPVASVTQLPDTTIDSSPTTTRDGYVFNGWYTDETYATPVTFPYTVTADATLYAKWTLNSFAVTFNSDGGSAVASQTVSYDGLVTEPTVPTKTGSTFSGWFADSALTDAWDFAIDKITVATTIYAKWTLNSFTVTFNSDGGSAVTSQTVGYDGLVTEPTAPTKTGYSFSGWYSDSALTDTWVFATDKITATTTIYAKWTLNSFTVTFNSDGGSAVASQTVGYDGLVTEPTAPTKTGSTFSGWFVDSALTDEWDFATDKITAATTIYAKWTLNSLTVTFSSDGGSAVASQTVSYDGLVTEPTAPTKTGYSFSGWYSDSALTDTWAFSTDKITSATTLYAKWTVLIPTMSLKGSSGFWFTTYTDGGTTYDVIRYGNNASVIADVFVSDLIVSNGYIEVYDMEGNLLISTASGSTATSSLAAVSTGVTIKLYRLTGVLEKTYGLVLKGDINGDGTIYANDVTLLKRFTVGTYPLGVYAKAASDINADDSIYATDVTLLKRVTVGLYTIDQMM